MADGLIFAYRVDTGERVRIPPVHMDIWPGVFTLEPPTAAAPAEPTQLPAAGGKKKPAKGTTTEAPAAGDDNQKE